MKKKQSKLSRRLFLFVPISIICIGYFVINVSYYAFRIYKLKNDVVQLNSSFDNLKYEESLLSTEIEKLKDPDYLARYARENYLYSKDGELIIKINTSEEEKITDSVDSTKYKYFLYGGGFVLFLIILHILKKSKQKN